MKTYNTTPTAQPVTAGEALTAFISALEFLGLFFVACIANALRTACRMVKACALWLRSSHTFADGDDSERVTLTGWQYIGVSFAVAAFAVLVSCAG